MKTGFVRNGTFWTAGTKLGNSGNKFYWMGHTTLFEFTNWGGNEPNDMYGRENCLEMVEYFDLKWNDYLCMFERYYVCEE